MAVIRIFLKLCFEITVDSQGAAKPCLGESHALFSPHECLKQFQPISKASKRTWLWSMKDTQTHTPVCTSVCVSGWGQGSLTGLPHLEPWVPTTTTKTQATPASLDSVVSLGGRAHALSPIPRAWQPLTWQPAPRCCHS